MSNIFSEIEKDARRNALYFSTDYPCYDWVDDNGYNNIGKWTEVAANKDGR